MLLYLLFFISGFTGLVYQVVWSREFLLIFGNTIYSVTTVVSVFMLGLTIGSLLFGYISDKIKRHIFLFSFLQVLIGIFSFLTIFLFDFIRNVYVSMFFGNYLVQYGVFIKFLLSTLVIILPTIFMGGTLPLLVKYFSQKKEISKVTSLLYFINTLGSFFGTLITAYILIEVLGLKGSIILGSILNIAAGLLGYFVSSKYKIAKEKIVNKKLKTKRNKINPRFIAIIFVFFLSGIISMSYEILWTRLLTPITGTYVYAFSIILSMILLGIAFGSFFYKYLFGFFKNKIYLLSLLQLGIGICAFLSLLAISFDINTSYYIRLIFVLLPATLLMGTMFPTISSFLEEYENKGFLIGVSFSANTLGSIIGPILAGFYLIAKVGTSRSIIILSILNICLSIFLLYLANTKQLFKYFISILTILLIIFISYKNNFLFLDSKTKNLINQAETKNWEYYLLEDEVASILAYSSGDYSKDEKGLYIDGVLTTTLTPQTKLLSHLPLFIHPNPKDLLVIAFGMGTSYKSALSHNINVDAVELVPSVPKVFNLFHPDFKDLNNKGNIFINDGRNYVLLTEKTYDIIVVDPPPPINASGTTVLYSKEFYRDSKRILNKNGLFVQWFWYGGREDDLKILFSAFRNSFSNILVALSPDGRGIFFIGSDEKITLNKDLIIERYKDNVYKDLNEWQEIPFSVNDILNLFVGTEKIIDRFILNSSPLSDDKPKTEYFFLRHKIIKLNDISADWVHPVEKLTY